MQKAAKSCGIFARLKVYPRSIIVFPYVKAALKSFKSTFCIFLSASLPQNLPHNALCVGKALLPFDCIQILQNSLGVVLALAVHQAYVALGGSIEL